MTDYSYLPDFKYTHDNPYHEKLACFDGFVMRDNEAEKYRGLWNKEVFKREAPLCVEIGTGYGHFMTQYCAANPHENFVGLDYRFKRSYALARQLDSLNSLHSGGLHFKYLRAKGERIHFQFGTSEVSKIYYFFPDPWPKNRHRKKRLFNEQFLQAAFQTLRPGGQLFIKTDHDDYARWMQKIIEQTDLFECELASFDIRKEYPEHFLSSFETKFEKIFLAKKIKIKGFVLTSTKATPLGGH